METLRGSESDTSGIDTSKVERKFTLLYFTDLGSLPLWNYVWQSWSSWQPHASKAPGNYLVFKNSEILCWKSLGNFPQILFSYYQTLTFQTSILQDTADACADTSSRSPTPSSRPVTSSAPSPVPPAAPSATQSLTRNNICDMCFEHFDSTGSLALHHSKSHM